VSEKRIINPFAICIYRGSNRKTTEHLPPPIARMAGFSKPEPEDLGPVVSSPTSDALCVRDKNDATWGDKDAGEEFCTNSSDFLFQGKQVKRCKGFFNSLQSMGRIKVDGPVGFKYFY
jgi:hypothetical protein